MKKVTLIRKKKKIDALQEIMEHVSKGDKILDVGGAHPFQKIIGRYKPLFTHCDYQTVDMDTSTNPDIVADIHKLPMKDKQYDGIVCNSVLEHCYDPAQVVKEIHRVMKKGAYAYMNFIFLYPYHAKSGHYEDYYRFSLDAVKLICKDFSDVRVYLVGGYITGLTNYLPQFLSWMRPIAKFLDRSTKSVQAGEYLVLAKR